jgi:hypothetical protein
VKSAEERPRYCCYPEVRAKNNSSEGTILAPVGPARSIRNAVWEEISTRIRI